MGCTTTIIGSPFYLTIEKSAEHCVPVVIWRITAPDERNLDSYEGFPYFDYKREFLLDVDTGDGIIRNARCFAYIMHGDRPLGLQRSAMWRRAGLAMKTLALTEKLLRRL